MSSPIRSNVNDFGEVRQALQRIERNRRTAPQHNLTATAPPSGTVSGLLIIESTNDETEGYSVGSFWVSTTPGTWVCVDATTSRAQWLDLAAAGVIGAPLAFTTIDCPAGTDPVAGTTGSTLTLAAGSTKQTITGDSATDTVTFDVVPSQIGLAELGTRAHSDLTGVSADQHHAQAHAFGGSDHTGLTISGPSTSDILQYSGSAWVDRSLAEAGISATGHTHAHGDLTGVSADQHHAQSHAFTGSDHTGVTISGPSTSDVLQYSGSAWVDRSLAEAGISATGHTHDDRYYTETELDAGQLDNRYYTETETDNLLTNMVTASSAITDGALVLGDGGVKGVKESTIVVGSLGAYTNVLKLASTGYAISKVGVLYGASEGKMIALGDTASAVNYLSIASATAGFPVRLFADSDTETNIGFSLEAQGTGSVELVGQYVNVAVPGDLRGVSYLNQLDWPAPVAGDDGKFLKYDHGTTAWVVDTAGGGTPTGIFDVYSGGTQTLTASSTIVATADSPYTPIDSAGAITLTSEPHIAAGADGQLVILKNVGSYNITMSDVNSVGGCLFRLTANTVTIQPGGSMGLIYDSTIGFWIEQWVLNPQTFTPSISSLTSNFSSTLEVAAAATSETAPSLALTYVGTPSACSIDISAGGDPGTSWPITVPSPYTALNSGTTPPSATWYAQTSVGGTRIFTATATVAGTGGLTKTLTHTYYNSRYFGPHTSSTTLTSAQVLALAGSAISNSRVGTFAATAGASNYVWFAYRAALGTGTLYFKNSSTGEIVAFTQKQTTLSHTNARGFIENFATYKSDLANLSGLGVTSFTAQTSPVPNNRIYMGPSTDTDPISTANILALDGANGDYQVASTVAGSYTVTISGSNYLWFCHPDRISDLTTIKDSDTGFGIAGSYRTNVSHTNDFGYTETYRCWRSDNVGIFPSGKVVTVT